MRTILLAGLWVLTLGGVKSAAAQTAADSVQVATLDRLKALVATYGPAREIRWYRPDWPYDVDGYLDKGLTYASRFEIYMTVTPRQTIWVRVYPQVGNEHVNLDRVRDPNGLMQQLLRFSYHNFFFWGADDASDVFAGFQFTLESGFPEDAIKVVIRSIPLIDESVGQMESFIE